MVKNPPANAGDTGDVGSIPGSGKSPEEGNGNPLQYSCLGNPINRGVWWPTVHWVTKSWALLSTHVHSSLKPVLREKKKKTLLSAPFNVSVSQLSFDAFAF